MPNIGAVLKQEIVRLSRRELNAQLQATRKASSQYRGSIAALKRQVATLERQVALLQRQKAMQSAVANNGSSDRKPRFVAKGLKSHRARLGLSAADFGRLVGVSPQTIYNWEQGNGTPRSRQLETVAVLRSLGKREARARLDKLASKGT
jgi:DNA-binding transcriptional regulator YiaG